MNFDAVFQLLLGNFKRYNIRFALIGGFALHVAGYSRMTEDIDFLVLKEDMPKVKRIMLPLDITYCMRARMWLTFWVE